jgi:hypothetical protein
MNPRVEKFLGDTMLYFVSALCECVYRVMIVWGCVTCNTELVKLSQDSIREQEDANAEYEETCQEFFKKKGK